MMPEVFSSVCRETMDVNATRNGAVVNINVTGEPVGEFIVLYFALGNIKLIRQKHVFRVRVKCRFPQSISI